MHDIVQRLRAFAPGTPLAAHRDAMGEAADALTAANKRIGELEEGLRPFARYSGATFGHDTDAYISGPSNKLLIRDFRRARALLSPSGSQE